MNAPKKYTVYLAYSFEDCVYENVVNFKTNEGMLSFETQTGQNIYASSGTRWHVVEQMEEVPAGRTR